MTGAEAMVKCLEAEGINLVFGYPGVAIAPFYEGLYNSDIEHVLVRQEQNPVTHLDPMNLIHISAVLSRKQSKRPLRKTEASQ